MVFIGDIHGEFNSLNLLIEQIPDTENIIQIGDLGLFNINDSKRIATLPRNFSFIRGNHDNPNLCRTNCKYLGEYGHTGKFQMFFVGGAYSIDQNERIENVSYWSDEEIHEKEWQSILDMYALVQPSLVVTHDCPASMYFQFFQIRDGQGKTIHLFDKMLKLHNPKRWVFGHHHRYVNQVVDGTQFICIPSCQMYDMSDVK